MTRRVLITGSRLWRDCAVIRAALASVWDHDVVLVSGACPRGADALCEACWTCWGGTVEPWPADWRGPCAGSCPRGHRRVGRAGGSYCPNAGYVRNHAMVNAGAELCLAFILNGSPGATHTAKLARSAGIPTRIFRANSQQQ